MSKDIKILSRIEELVLIAVWRLKDDAYGVPIRKYVNNVTGVEWSIGAIYVPLEKLNKLGYLFDEMGEPTAKRGGQSKRFYKLTKRGVEALEHVRRVEREMWDDLPDLSAVEI